MPMASLTFLPNISLIYLSGNESLVASQSKQLRLHKLMIQGLHIALKISCQYFTIDILP